MLQEVDFTISETDRLKKTLSQLALKIKQLEDDKLSLKEKYEKEISKLNTQISSTNRSSYIITATDKHKQVIKLFAFGFSIGHIYKICTEEMNIDITLEEIDSIVNGIDFAHENLQLFYVEMKKLFQEKNSLDKGFFASSLYKKLQLLESEMSISLTKAKEMGDEQLKLKCSETLLKIYEKMTTMFSKNGMDIFSKNMAVKMLEDYDSKTDGLKKDKENNIEVSLEDIVVC